VNDNAVKFSAVGDLTFGDHPLCVGFGAGSRFRSEDPLFPFRKALPVLQKSELLFGNLECTHSSLDLRSRDYHSVQMRGEPRVIRALPKAGFHVVNVANNHSLQHGNDTFRDTVSMLEGAGIGCCGIAADALATRAKPLIVQRNGLAIGFLGYSLRPRQYFEHVPLYAEGHANQMECDVTELRGRVDVVVVSVHWGEEFIQEPAPQEMQLARRLVDAGAALIIGHHPHVLRGIERHDQGCIVYSLGNFVCDMVWDDTLRNSMVFECELTSAGVRNVNLVPVFINDNFQPEPLSGPRAERALQHIEKLSADLSRAPASTVTAADQEYALRADAIHRQIRAKSHRFFVSRFWRYPAGMLIQQLLTYVRNRLHERLVRA
jgi:poly-gamma-glutamate synthesis protein (capsule biosynthesis protein)